MKSLFIADGVSDGFRRSRAPPQQHSLSFHVGQTAHGSLDPGPVHQLVGLGASSMCSFGAELVAARPATGAAWQPRGGGVVVAGGAAFDAT